MMRKVAVLLTSILAATTPVTASTIAPAGAVEADLPDKNTWGFDSWVFMEVRIPTIARDAVILDEEFEGEEIPVLQFVPNDGWTHLLDEDGAQVWFYEEVVPDGASFTPLFSEWTMTNFRIANNMSGETTSEELEALMNQNEVKRYCIQSEGFLDEAPEILWSMVR